MLLLRCTLSAYGAQWRPDAENVRPLRFHLSTRLVARHSLSNASRLSRPLVPLMPRCRRSDYDDPLAN